MKIPYIDHAKHVEALIRMGISKGNIYGNWSEEDVQNLQKKFDFYQGYLQAGHKFSKDSNYFYFSEDYSLGGGAINSLEQDFSKIIGWTALMRVLKNRVNLKIL